jgi:phage terminase large subunit
VAPRQIIVPNPGAQKAFIENEHLYSAYIGGIGSGKSFAGIARALKYALQERPPGVYDSPRGTIASATFPLLRDAIYPIAEELINSTGAGNWSKDFKKQEKVIILANGARMQFRSLDDPDTVMRGPELAYVFIDEGRNVTLYHWKLVVGRLRQKGYKRGAWVASTPNGFDWMYNVFHPEAEDHWPDAEWYGAPTYENPHLPPEYMDALSASYEGRFYEQEVLGHFIGVVSGSVFPFWEPREAVTEDVAYNPDLPLYTFWDFGYGDLGVCIFAQVEWLEPERPPGSKAPMGPRVRVPWLYILDVISAKEWTSEKWAGAWKDKLNEDFGGAVPRGNFGDPAGKQRQGTTGTSYIEDLVARGVPVEPVAKRPPDWALRLLSNMMAGGRVVVHPRAQKVSDAFSQYHYKTDGSGDVVGDLPVHDWTSHYVDAVRYGAVALLSHFARAMDEPDSDRPFAPNEYGYVFNQLVEKDETRWLGPRRKRGAKFLAPTIGG